MAELSPSRQTMMMTLIFPVMERSRKSELFMIIVTFYAKWTSQNLQITFW